MSDLEREKLVILRRIADFFMGYQISDENGANPLSPSMVAMNNGIAMAASQVLDENDNQELIAALNDWARSESAPSDLRRAWEQGRGNTKSVVFEYGSYFLSHYAHAVVLDEIDKLEYPGESTPTTPKVMPKMLDRARQWLEKHAATVESDQVAHFMAGFANDVVGEAGSPAPAPTEEK